MNGRQRTNRKATAIAVRHADRSADSGVKVVGTARASPPVRLVSISRYNICSRSSAFSGTRWSGLGCAEDHMDKTARIRELNDAFRRTFVGGRVMLTAGVDALADAEKAAVLAKVRTFDAFSGDNDPHNEHDFVSFEHEGV